MDLNHPKARSSFGAEGIVMGQTALPEDPMENTTGSRYLRLTNECPKQGIVLQLEEPQLVESRFKGDGGTLKKEYHWPCIQWTPEPVEKVLNESSPGFCTALKKATNANPYRIPLQIKWVKSNISGGRQQKDWSIRILKQEDIKAIFAEG